MHVIKLKSGQLLHNCMKRKSHLKKAWWVTLKITQLDKVIRTATRHKTCITSYSAVAMSLSCTISEILPHYSVHDCHLVLIRQLTLQAMWTTSFTCKQTCCSKYTLLYGKSLIVMSYDFLLVFHCNHVSNLYYFWDITSYLPKFKVNMALNTFPLGV